MTFMAMYLYLLDTAIISRAQGFRSRRPVSLESKTNRLSVLTKRSHFGSDERRVPEKRVLLSETSTIICSE